MKRLYTVLLLHHLLKNRQPWKFIVYQGEEKDKLVDAMSHGINSEKTTHELMPEWAFAMHDSDSNEIWLGHLMDCQYLFCL